MFSPARYSFDQWKTYTRAQFSARFRHTRPMALGIPDALTNQLLAACSFWNKLGVATDKDNRSTTLLRLWRWSKPLSDDKRKIISPQYSTTTSTQKRPRAASPFLSWKKQRATTAPKNSVESTASSTLKGWKSTSHP